MHIRRISKATPAQAVMSLPTAGDIIGLISSVLDLIVSGRAAVDAVAKKPTE